MMRHDTAELGSPWQQAGRLAFLALYAVTLLAALGWALSNVRQVGPENRVVVLRLGALHRIQNAGLLLAWPRPFEQVVILPSLDRVIEHHVATLLRSPQALQADNYVSKFNPVSDALAGSGYLLTGDAGVVQLDVRVFYRVVEPYDYVLQRAHITPALERLATRSTVTVCAARDLDTILVARPELVGASSQAAERRERLRGDLVHKPRHDILATSVHLSRPYQPATRGCIETIRGSTTLGLCTCCLLMPTFLRLLQPFYAPLG